MKYCISIIAVHALSFWVVSMLAVRYDLGGGLPTYIIVYQGDDFIFISMKFN